MNRYDFYFEQLISQTEMDQAFAWVADTLERWTQAALSDPTDPGGAWNGGILEGGTVTQQTVPDLSVRVSALVAYDKIGRPIIDATAQQTVPVDVDEYGTATVVAAPGNNKILSVFVRYKLDPQDPAVDGNGLTVYTKQIDDVELFVRQSAEAGSPTAPPLLPDALLLADLTLAYGQTTILTGHIGTGRREDWIRLIGTSISLIAGTPREALRELFAYVDTAMGGGSLYTPGYDWYGSTPLGTVGGAAPTTVMEALDDIVQDLADNTTGGDLLIGGAAVTGTPGGRADLIAGSTASKVAALAGIVASHQTECVNATEIVDWEWLLLSTKGGFTPGDMTSQAGGTATAVAVLGATAGWVLVHSKTGTWTTGQGIDYGGSYVAAEAYLLDRVTMDDVVTTTDLQTVLEATAGELARLGKVASEDTLQLFGDESSRALRVDHAHLGGAGHPNGALGELNDGYWTDDDEPAWALPYQTKVACSAGNLVSICRGWDYRRNIGCAYVVGDTLVVSKIFVQSALELGIDEDFMDLTIDAAGTLMSTLTPTRKTYAVACNGKYLYVLVGYGTGSPDAEIYCYDARVWRSSGLAQWVWTTAVPTVSNGLGNTKADSNLVANDRYVVALLGAENCSTGTPLCRMDADDGANPTLGKGDGASGPNYTPTGGLAISRGNVAADHRMFYTCWDTVSAYECIPALHDLTTTGKTPMTLLDMVRDVVLVGRHVVLPEWDGGGAGLHYIRLWDFETNDTAGLCVQIQSTSSLYPLARAAFDGTNIWFKLCSPLGGEQHVVVPVHAGEIVNCGMAGSQIIACDHRYLMTPPLNTGAISTGAMGRFIAWGPGVFSILGESSNMVNFLPLNRGVR